MNEEEVKKSVKERLASYPKFKAFCSLCGKYLCTQTVERKLICWDCWVKYRVPKEKTGRELLEDLVREIKRPQ